MLRIFVADDELLVIEGIRILLDSVNVECEIIGTANNGTEAWKNLCNGEMKIDFLLTDIRMPGMSGLELIENCREIYPEMMTAVISGYREFVYAQQAIGLGVIGYIDKPITRQKLEAVLALAQEKQHRLDLTKQDKTYLLHQCDEMIHFLTEGACENALKCYHEVKEQLHRETFSLESYKTQMYMIVSYAAGAYYDHEDGAVSDSGADQHYPSYRNLRMLQSRDEVDDYADCIVNDIIRKLQMRQRGVVHGTIKEILKYIEENYDKDISLYQIADEAGMNSAYLSALFKGETGISYVRYLTELRVNKAKEFLTEGYLVSEVSDMVGYHNYRYFCDVFKKSTGMTPNEYKGTIRKREGQGL